MIALLSYAWCEVALNFQFHWVTNGDLGVGLSLPANFQLIIWIAFVTATVAGHPARSHAHEKAPSRGPSHRAP